MSSRRSSDNKSKSHLLRNIALVVIVVILSIGSYAAIRILTFRPQGTPLTKNVVWGVVTVNATSYRVYPFSIPSTATWSSVQGTFTVSGDSGNGIRVYIMNATELVNWQNGQAFSTYCSSEETTTGNIVADPPAGETYYLVFDNTFSATSKSVDAKVYVMYLID